MPAKMAKDRAGSHSARAAVLGTWPQVGRAPGECILTGAWPLYDGNHAMPLQLLRLELTANQRHFWVLVRSSPFKVTKHPQAAHDLQ